MKNCNMILTEKPRKYQLYHQAKLINMNTSLVKKYCHRINDKLLNKLNLLILLWGKAFEKQIKTNEDQGKKQFDALTTLKTSNKKLPSIKDFISIENLNRQIINEIKRIEEIEKNVDRDKMVYKSANKTYDFRSFKTILTFGNKIRNNVISMTTANTEQANLLNHIEDFIIKTKPRDHILKNLKEDILASAFSLLKGREMVYNAFESGIFQRLEESQESEGLKILTPNQMLKRLPIALSQIKPGNNSESLLNEIRQIAYSLY